MAWSELVDVNEEDCKGSSKGEHGASGLNRVNGVDGIDGIGRGWQCSYSHRHVRIRKCSPLDGPINAVKLGGKERVQKIATGDKIHIRLLSAQTD